MPNLNDAEFLNWVANRLVNGYGELEKDSRIIRLRSLAREAAEKSRPFKESFSRSCCPCCSSTKLRDKGTFDKCLDCGSRFDSEVISVHGEGCDHYKPDPDEPDMIEIDVLTKPPCQGAGFKLLIDANELRAKLNG